MQANMAVVDEKPKPAVVGTEVEDADALVGYTAEQIQHRFDTLRGLSQGEMEALNKKVRRIIDWRLMPCITLMFLMKYVSCLIRFHALLTGHSYLDRINVSNARLAGLQEDLHMSDTVRRHTAPPEFSEADTQGRSGTPASLPSTWAT